jgi:hypothetical protein
VPGYVPERIDIQPRVDFVQNRDIRPLPERPAAESRWASSSPPEKPSVHVLFVIGKFGSMLRAPISANEPALALDKQGPVPKGLICFIVLCDGCVSYDEWPGTMARHGQALTALMLAQFSCPCSA